MLRRLRILLIITALVIVGLPLLIVGTVLILGNVDSGRRLIERTIEHLTDGKVRLQGLAGRFPDRLRLSGLQLLDQRGLWLTAEEVRLDSSPWALIGKRASVGLLHVGTLAIERAPDYGPSKPSKASSGGLWFHEMRLDRLDLQRLELGAPLVGNRVAVRIQGSARIYSLQLAWAQLSAQRLDSVRSTYEAAAQIDPKQVNVHVDLEEDAGGPLTHLARVPDLGALVLHLYLNGPREAVQTTLDLHAGALTAAVRGSVNLPGRGADLAVDLESPALPSFYGVSWDRLSLHGTWRGTLAAAMSSARLQASGVKAPDVEAKSLQADLRGQGDRLLLDATVGGFRIDSPALLVPDAKPLVLHGELNLADRARPIDFTLNGALASIRGRWNITTIDGSASADVTDIRPFVAMGGLDLAGRGSLNVKFNVVKHTGRLETSAELDIRGGSTLLTQLLRPHATARTTLIFRDDGLHFDNTRIDASNVQASMSGTILAGVLNLGWKLSLPTLAELSPELAGNLSGSGQIKGTSPKLTLDADASGTLSAHGSPAGPLRLVLRARDLPEHTNGTLEISGTLDGAALELAVDADAARDGSLSARIERGDWKSMHAEGAMRFDPNAQRPQGKLALHVPNLADLDRLLGQPLQGSIDASVLFDEREGKSRAHVNVDARGIGVPAQQIEQLRLRGDITAPGTTPLLALHLSAATLLNGRQAHLTTDARGPLENLDLRATATLDAAGDGEGIIDAPVRLDAVATLDTGNSECRLTEFKLDYRKQTLRLLAPATINYADGLGFDRIHLGSGDAELQASGRVSPTLDLRASASNLTSAPLHALLPDVQLDGRVDAHAELTGTLDKPTGSVELHAVGLRPGGGVARGLPPTNLDFKAQLAEQTAQVDLQMRAGEGLDFTLDGQAPLNASATMAIKAKGAFDLSVLNPILEAGGQRALGKVRVDMQLAGTPELPQARGTLALTGVSVQDYARGARLTDINATIDAEGDTLTLQQFTARAAPGTITANGTVKLGEGAWPVELKVSGHDAQPLASDLITANVDVDLTLSGDLRDRLNAAGTVHINRAVINIPNALPPNIPTLKVVRAGRKPPPPPKPSKQVVALDYKVVAPRAVFVRGRGIDAELGGQLHVAGTLSDVTVSGAFELRQGTINLGGATLTFDPTSRISFNGSGVNKRIVPTLDFKATSYTSGSQQAILTVQGFADAPVITLSSDPPGEPQDQILAQLLFGSSPSTLTPLQLAQVGAALVTLGGIVGGSGGFNPIDTVQRTLGLDRLSIGGGGSSTGTTGSNAGSTGQPGSVPGTNENAATIEAGRYISSRVYVGAKQSTAGPTQAQVQIDLTRKLKLQATLGNGGGSVQGATPQNDPGSSVGIAYQFEY
jgi:translocation and assembly module TamB